MYLTYNIVPKFRRFTNIEKFNIPPPPPEALKQHILRISIAPSYYLPFASNESSRITDAQ
jgi:hypothetical protein